MLQLGKAMGLAGRLGRTFTVAIMLLSLGVIAKPAQASPLNLTMQTFPDIRSDLIDISYDATSQTLTAHGFAEHITNGFNETTPITNGTFEIVASITNTGSITSGTLTIIGGVPSLGIPQGILVTGNLSVMGFGDADGPVELQFDTNGGSFAVNYGPVIGVILGQSGFSGSFTRDFSSNSTAVADTGR